MDISNIFSSILEISIISSIIGIVIILLRQLLKGRVNSKWIYAIWFILLFKLLMPIKIESVVSIFNFTPEYITENSYIENSKKEYETLKQNYNYYITNNEIAEEINIDKNVNNDYEVGEIKQQLNTYMIKNNIIKYVIPSIWLCGTITMLLWLTISNILLNLKLNNVSHKDERLEEILKKCKNKMNVKRKINIIINDLISTPALFGIFKVKILIPKYILNLDDKNLEYIILHELSHYKRKDIWINYILLIIQSIHWFNPIIWICFKLLRNDLELATDEYVLKYLEENKYKEYANALIETLSIATNSKITPSLIGMIDNKENIKRRIIMIKSLEIFKKKKVVISIVCIILIVAFSLFLLTSPITSDVPKDEFYISSISEENKIHLGAYKWKYILGETIADSIAPLEYAKTVDKIRCNISQKVELLTEEKVLKNIRQIEIIELENNFNMVSVNNITINSKIEFIAPDTIGTYYYLAKVYYTNDSYVEYVFSLEITEDKNIEEDKSPKIAKVMSDVSWNVEEQKYNGSFVKEISQNQIDNINKIVQRGERVIASVSWAEEPDYTIEFNNGERRYIDIRISEDATISIETHESYMSVYTIYSEEDVNYILNLVGEKNKYASLPIMDLNKYKTPMDLYWCGEKLKIGTYDWKIPGSNNVDGVINADSIPPKEMLKDETIEWIGAFGIVISTYSKNDNTIQKLPKETKVEYKIYNVNEEEYNVEFKEATRMIDGSYYLSELPSIRGEYIVEIYVSFGELNDNSVHYYKKYKF